MKDKLRVLGKQISIVIPLLLISAYSSSTDALAPILNNISEAFPDASLTLVQLTLTLPSAVSIPVQLLTVLLAQYMTKKQMMVVAIMFICVGGLIPLAIHSSIYILIVSSVIIGIGQGFFMPASNAIMGELFDGNARGAFMGIKTGVSAFLRTGLTLLVGFLGVAYWHRSYWIFAIMIPLIVLFIWKIPKGEKSTKIVGKGVGLSGVKAILTPPFIVLTVLAFFATVSQFAYMTNISGFIAEKGLGDSVQAGAATAFNTMARFIVGFALGFLLKIFKKYTLPLGYFINAIGFIVLFSATGMVGVQVGGIIFGFGLGIQMAAGMYYMSETIEKSAMSQAFGLYMPFISFAVSVSPVVINSLSKALFGATTATNNIKIGFYGYLFTAIAMTLFMALFQKDSKIGTISGLEAETASDIMEEIEEEIDESN